MSDIDTDAPDYPDFSDYTPAVKIVTMFKAEHWMIAQLRAVAEASFDGSTYRMLDMIADAIVEAEHQKLTDRNRRSPLAPTYKTGE